MTSLLKYSIAVSYTHLDVYKRQDPGVPVRRGRAYLCGDLANALIDVIEKAVQISHDTIDEQTFQPFNDCVDDKVHTSAPFLEKGTTGDI